LLLLYYGQRRKKDDEWKGELVKKRFNRGDEESRPSYILIFKTDEGKKKRFSTPSEEYWHEWEVGDRAEKVKGEFFPSKV
jgi:hypothetical protein